MILFIISILTGFIGLIIDGSSLLGTNISSNNYFTVLFFVLPYAIVIEKIYRKNNKKGSEWTLFIIFNTQ